MAAEHFEHKNLRGARFEDCDLSEVWFRNVLMIGTRITGALMVNVEIDAGLDGPVVINGVDVRDHIDDVLNERHPGRATVLAVREGDADAFRAAWAVDQEAWAETVERARRLPEERLHERVDDEWSFIETLRHLVFATDSWVRRAIQGDPWPYDELDLPFTEMDRIDGMVSLEDARPTLDEILALRADRMASVTAVIEALTDEQLASSTEPVPGPGYPASESFPVRRCLAAIMLEEWEHHRFANRDLTVLEGGT